MRARESYETALELTTLGYQDDGARLADIAGRLNEAELRAVLVDTVCFAGLMLRLLDTPDNPAGGSLLRVTATAYTAELVANT